MTTPYRHRPDRVAAARQFLLSAQGRTDADLPRYGEVAQEIGHIAQGVAPGLNSVARDCTKAGAQDLSVIVVMAGFGPPGRLKGHILNPADLPARDAWQAELKRIRAHDWA